MKTITDIWRENIQDLINNRFGGNKAKFAAEIGRAPTQIGGPITRPDKKKFGVDLIREIESYMGFEPGTLDHEGACRPETPSEALEKRIAEVVRGLPLEVLAVIFHKMQEALLSSQARTIQASKGTRATPRRQAPQDQQESR